MTCDVQYGGRITDDLDREMFIAYGQLWITEEVFREKYCSILSLLITITTFLTLLNTLSTSNTSTLFQKRTTL